MSITLVMDGTLPVRGPSLQRFESRISESKLRALLGKLDSGVCTPGAADEIAQRIIGDCYTRQQRNQRQSPMAMRWLLANAHRMLCHDYAADGDARECFSLARRARGRPVAGPLDRAHDIALYHWLARQRGATGAQALEDTAATLHFDKRTVRAHIKQVFYFKCGATQLEQSAVYYFDAKHIKLPQERRKRSDRILH